MGKMVFTFPENANMYEESCFFFGSMNYHRKSSKLFLQQSVQHNSLSMSKGLSIEIWDDIQSEEQICSRDRLLSQKFEG